VMRTVLRFVVAPVFGFLAATRVIWVGILVVLMALLFAASSLVAAVSFFWALANLIGAALGQAAALHTVGLSVATCAAALTVNLCIFHLGGKVWRAA
jgi:hypothetical protein